jgi:glycosyltransferase involved in cell wall biosynthesis
MRILFLADGISIHTYRWIQYFADKGHEILLISMSEYKFEPHHNITVYKIPQSNMVREKIFSYIIYTLMNLFSVKKLIRTFNPDILHAHFLSDYGFLGYLVHFRVFVVTVWGSDILITPKKSLFSKITAYLILNSAALVTCDSNIVKHECVKYCKNPNIVKIIQWGVDLSVFHERKRNRGNCNEITVLSTRNFQSIYNIDTIVEAIPFALEKYSTIRFILKSYVGTQEPELRKLASSLNVYQYIEFFNKRIEYNELPELLYRADIYISVPSSDSSSVALLEAMACGLPVIVSDIPANHEWIIDGWNGFIVPVRNPEKIANAIIQLIEKPDLMQLFGERNVQIIRDRVDREKHMAYMENLYKQLLEKLD